MLLVPDSEPRAVGVKRLLPFPVFQLKDKVIKTEEQLHEFVVRFVQYMHTEGSVDERSVTGVTRSIACLIQLYNTSKEYYNEIVHSLTWLATSLVSLHTTLQTEKHRCAMPSRLIVNFTDDGVSGAGIASPYVSAGQSDEEIKTVLDVAYKQLLDIKMELDQRRNVFVFNCSIGSRAVCGSAVIYVVSSHALSPSASRIIEQYSRLFVKLKSDMNEHSTCFLESHCPHMTKYSCI
jgi:hypothetical protein